MDATHTIAGFIESLLREGAAIQRKHGKGDDFFAVEKGIDAATGKALASGHWQEVEAAVVEARLPTPDDTGAACQEVPF